jgi:predicted branched-subunit amino acid permease
MRNEITRGMKDSIPICAGYLAVGFTFGIAAAAQGINAAGAGLICLTIVTSAGQFAGLTVIAAGAPLVEMALTQLIINLRYLLMSTSLSQKFDPSIKWFEKCKS